MGKGRYGGSLSFDSEQRVMRRAQEHNERYYESITGRKADWVHGEGAPGNSSGRGSLETYQECSAERAVFSVPPRKSESAGDVSYEIGGYILSGEVKCSCPGFSYRGRCKHLKVRTEKCSWNSKTSPEVQTEEEKRTHICPVCGSKTFDVGSGGF